MHDPIIFSKIQLLGYVIDDIRELEDVIRNTGDPALVLQYREDMRGLIAELNEVSSRCIVLLAAYIEGCKDADYPISLDYYRVWKELTKAMK
jgi:hypothetical protein